MKIFGQKKTLFSFFAGFSVFMAFASFANVAEAYPIFAQQNYETLVKQTVVLFVRTVT